MNTTCGGFLRHAEALKKRKKKKKKRNTDKGAQCVTAAVMIESLRVDGSYT